MDDARQAFPLKQSVRFWIEDGVEVATLHAADFREAMRQLGDRNNNVPVINAELKCPRCGNHLRDVTHALNEVGRLEGERASLFSEQMRLNTEVNGLRAEAERLARQHNTAVERMRIAEFRESELQQENERLRAEVEDWKHGSNHEAEEADQLRGELNRLSDHYQKLMAECDQMASVIGALKDIIAMTDPCIHQQMVNAKQAHADGRTMSLDEYMASRGIGI